MRFLIYCDVSVPWLTDWTLTLGPTLKLKLKLYEIPITLDQIKIFRNKLSLRIDTDSLARRHAVDIKNRIYFDWY